MPSGVPVKRVRMLAEGETFRNVSDRRHYQYVKPGSNHHIVYRAVGKGGQEKWTAEVVTMWDGARRALADKPLPLTDRSDGPKGRFLFSLSIGEMFEIHNDNRTRSLCAVHKIKQSRSRLYDRLHTDARKDDERKELWLSPRQMQQRRAWKVTVGPTGRVRRASD